MESISLIAPNIAAALLILLGIASLGAVTVRLLSSVFDSSASIKNIGGIVAETLLGALFLLSWDGSS